MNTSLRFYEVILKESDLSFESFGLVKSFKFEFVIKYP